MIEGAKLMIFPQVRISEFDNMVRNSPNTLWRYRRHLCYLPWNPDISPKLSADPRVASGIPCMWLPAPRAANVLCGNDFFSFQIIIGNLIVICFASKFPDPPRPT